VLTGYALAAMTMVEIYASGTLLGVRLTAGEYVRMTLLTFVGLIPFAALGILLGRLLTPDSMGPALSGMTAALAILGGVWFPNVLRASRIRARHEADVARGPPVSDTARPPGV
jgi:ABC-2 type transport system permease protein